MRRLVDARCFVLVAVGALVTATAAAAAPSRSVSLALAGSHPKAPARCGDAHADLYSAVRSGSAVDLVGVVRPAPAKAGWRVRVVVKRCVNKHYTRVWTGMAAGRKGGAFRVAYTPKSGGLFIAVADYGRGPNVTSRKVRLHVG